MDCLRIDLPAVDFQCQRVLDQKKKFIELTPKTLRYYGHFVADEKDKPDDLQWQEGNIRCWDNFYLRKFLAGAFIDWNHEEKVWKLRLCISGCMDTDFWFKDRGAARAVLKILRDYIEEGIIPDEAPDLTRNEATDS